jgi:hypothetical protein
VSDPATTAAPSPFTRTRPMLSYPLQLTFKLIAVAPQISVTDGTGRLLLYVRQKAFKLKEAVTVFADVERTRPLYTIAADRVLDFSAQYHVATAEGAPLGVVQRRGMRSLWKAHYDVSRDGAPLLALREENPWVKLADGLLGEIPLVGLLSGYLLNPKYIATRPDGTAVLRVRKRPALFEGRYEVTRLAELSDTDEELALLALLMLVLLERTRG